MRAVGSFPVDTRAGGEPDNWTGIVNNFTGGGMFQSFAAYAICRK